MASKRGLQQRMKDEIRKRQARPRPQTIATGNVRRDRWEEITRNHMDVLQTIEATLVNCWREAEGVDDQWIHAALVATMRGDSPDHPTAWYVHWALKAARERRSDVAADLWLDALRVVAQSVRDHSSLRHGDRSYLGFILAFVVPAPGDADGEDDYRIIEGRISAPQPPE